MSTMRKDDILQKTIIGIAALIALFRFQLGIIPTIAACGATGLIIRLLAG